MKAYYKNEIARFAGISIKTLSKYIDQLLNDPAFFNYRKKQQLLTPLQCEILCQRYGIVIDN